MTTPEWKRQPGYEDIIYEKADGIGKITIDRPEVRNAFRPLTVQEMQRAFPGPATLVIPLGLAILATEYAWARKPLLWMRALLGRLRLRVRRMLGRQSPPSSPTVRQ